MPELRRFDASRPLNWDELWPAFDEDGGLIVEDFVAPELLARLQTDFAPLIASREPGSSTDGLWTELQPRALPAGLPLVLAGVRRAAGPGGPRCRSETAGLIEEQHHHSRQVALEREIESCDFYERPSLSGLSR